MKFNKYIIAIALLCIPTYGESNNSNNGDVLKIVEDAKNSKTTVTTRALGYPDIRKDSLDVDISHVNGLSGKIHISFVNLDISNTIVLNFNMKDVHINKSIIEDIDLDCIFSSSHTGDISYIHPFFETKASSHFFMRLPYNMPDDEWKTIKFERILEINETYIFNKDTKKPQAYSGYMWLKLYVKYPHGKKEITIFIPLVDKVFDVK